MTRRPPRSTPPLPDALPIHPRALARAHNTLGALAGDPEEPRLHLERSLALAEALDDPEARLAALNNLARLHGAAGETAQAIERTEAALALCVALGDRHREAALHNNLADLLHAAGRQIGRASCRERA